MFHGTAPCRWRGSCPHLRRRCGLFGQTSEEVTASWSAGQQFPSHAPTKAEFDQLCTTMRRLAASVTWSRGLAAEVTAPVWARLFLLVTVFLARCSLLLSAGPRCQASWSEVNDAGHHGRHGQKESYASDEAQKEREVATPFVETAARQCCQ